MSIKTKIATLAVAALAVVAATTADAKPKINPVAAGLFGAAVVGTTILAASQPRYGYYPHRRHCWLEARQNMFTGQVFYVKQCRVHY